MNIETKTARLKLQQRWKPYWQKLSGGTGLGYRRTEATGTWSVRLADGKGGYSQKRIAAADDYDPADGKSIMSYAQARDAAIRLGRGEDIEKAATSIVTLEDAIEAYQAHLETTSKRARSNIKRLLFNLPPAMRKRPISLLSVEELLAWREAARQRMASASVNRVAANLRAALNLAAKKDPMLNGYAWRVGLATLADAVVANNVVISDDTVRRLVHAAREYSPEFGLLVETLAMTGARISQIARCNVRDLVRDRLMVPSSLKGRNKRSRPPVPVPLPMSLIAALRAASVERRPGDLLFVKPSGEPWGEQGCFYPFRKIVAAIGEDPAVLTSYALRHTHITGQLLRGLPVQLVSKLHDTSAVQIERHYAAEIASQADELVRGAMLQIDQPQANIVPLRR